MEKGAKEAPLIIYGELKMFWIAFVVLFIYIVETMKRSEGKKDNNKKEK